MRYQLIPTSVITTNTYNVDNAFYLVVPKMLSTKEIEIVVEYSAGQKMPVLSNTDKITIIRPLSKEFLDRINEVSIRYQLKSLIQNDLIAVKKILSEKGITYSDKVSFKTENIEFVNWYQQQTEASKKNEAISASSATPEQEYKQTSEDLFTPSMQKEELLVLKAQAEQALLAVNAAPNNSVKPGSEGDQRGKRLVKSNGQSTLPRDEKGHVVIGDGFINILLLSFVTAFVTIGTVVAMLYILR